MVKSRQSNDLVNLTCGYEPEGREFKPLRARHLPLPPLSLTRRACFQFFGGGRSVMKATGLRTMGSQSAHIILLRMPAMPGNSSGKRPPAPDLSSTCTEQ